jgi:hypothetical protein
MISGGIMTDKEKETRNEKLKKLAGYIVLIKKPGDTQWYGPVGHSFSMEVLPWRTQFFWSSDCTPGNSGTDPHIIDGKDSAYESIGYWKGLYPRWNFFIYDARNDAALPVVIDWDAWMDANQPANTISGVKNEFNARNLFIKSGAATKRRGKKRPSKLAMEVCELFPERVI